MKANLKLIGGKLIKSPKSENTRPTSLFVREAIFNILSNKVKESYWLDLFSGTGSIACEAYNHGAKKIIAIEKNKNNSKICKNNLLSLHNAENRKSDMEVICKDVLIWTKPNYERKSLSKKVNFSELKFDFIYLDPPYGNNYLNLVLHQVFNCDFIKKDSMVICEHTPDLEIKKNNLWKIIDVRDYGQSRLTFLINIQHS